jgi:predicted PolB exonuclease-like 3'-5' exonuclease
MKADNSVIFDIETGSLPAETIEEIAPPFRESGVKTGNLGLDKALEKIKQAREHHLGRIQDTAALNAEYGQVLAIGIIDHKGGIDCLHGDEKGILQEFWQRAEQDFKTWSQGNIQWVGFNCLGFDLPFLFRRSMLRGVPVPRTLIPSPRYWPSFWVDLMDVWKAGDYRAMISLDRFCKAAGLPGKNGDGAHFQHLYQEDQDAAIAYLENDLIITRNLADKILPLMI